MLLAFAGLEGKDNARIQSLSGGMKRRLSLARALVNAAYTRVDLVERRGEFAVRGGIIDVFPPTEEHPVRVDFFGDTVEEIRHFQVSDQRSEEDTLPEITASPCREMLITDAVRERALTHARDGRVPGPVRELFERIADGRLAGAQPLLVLEQL